MINNFDLNRLSIENADGEPVPIRPNGPMIDQLAVGVAAECYFDRLPKRMVSFINEFPIIVGCMAWLTNELALKALATRAEVSIIVQKEDFLRPDAGTWSERKIKDLYGKLPPADRSAARCNYNYGGDQRIDPVRCAGVAKSRREVPPRMHHKFLIGCHTAEDDGRGWVGQYYRPVAVWTGSFNATENGARSLENAVILRDPKIAEKYFAEWVRILGISEPLDWTSKYVTPEYRIGT